MCPRRQGTPRHTRAVSHDVPYLRSDVAFGALSADEKRCAFLGTCGHYWECDRYESAPVESQLCSPAPAKAT